MTPTDPALVQEARAAGLVDHDLLRLAPSGAPPALAVANLRDRFPSAFLKHARDMSEPEFKAAVAALAYPKPAVMPDNLRKHVSEMSLDEKEAFERFHGIHITSGERRRRQEIRDEREARREMRA